MTALAFFSWICFVLILYTNRTITPLALFFGALFGCIGLTYYAMG